MGYYSQVSYAIEFPNEEHLKNFVATFRVIPELKQALEDTRAAGKVLFMDMDGVKWYDEFEDVKAHTRLIKEANDLGYATCFVHVGEDNDVIAHAWQDSEHEDYGGTVVCGYDLLNTDMRIVKYFDTDNPITVDALLGLTESKGETK